MQLYLLYKWMLRAPCSSSQRRLPPLQDFITSPPEAQSRVQGHLQGTSRKQERRLPEEPELLPSPLGCIPERTIVCLGFFGFFLFFPSFFFFLTKPGQDIGSRASHGESVVGMRSGRAPGASTGMPGLNLGFSQ